jgi:hypothetical protein
MLLPSSGSNNDSNKQPGQQQSASASNLSVGTVCSSGEILPEYTTLYPRSLCFKNEWPLTARMFEVICIFSPHLPVNLVDAGLF